MDFNNKIAVVTGENICIDGGMTRQMIYHGDNGWRGERYTSEIMKKTVKLCVVMTCKFAR